MMAHIYTPSETSAAHTNFKNGDTVKMQIKIKGSLQIFKNRWGTVSLQLKTMERFFTNTYLARITTHYKDIYQTKIKIICKYWYMITHI